MDGLFDLDEYDNGPPLFRKALLEYQLAESGSYNFGRCTKQLMKVWSNPRRYSHREPEIRQEMQNLRLRGLG